MTEPRAWKLTVGGIVQGVGYRAFVSRKAKSYDLAGYVKNEDDGTVTIFVQGPEDEVHAFIEEIRKPPFPAKVSYIKRKETTSDSNLREFIVVYR
ncbi:MAG: acylphosphatase [Conexivisphaerales archaeon]